MSQVDRLHYFSSLIWVIFFFIIWYCFIAGFCFPLYYKNLRGRYLLEKFIWSNINYDSYLLKLIVNFFDLFSIKSLKQFLVFNLVWKYRSYYFNQTVYGNVQEAQDNLAGALQVYNDSNNFTYNKNSNKSYLNSLISVKASMQSIRNKQNSYFDSRTACKVYLKKSINNTITSHKRITRC